MTNATPALFVVDDDPSVRKALARFFRSVGLCAQTFASAQEFLNQNLPDAPCCLVLDVQMPGLDGLALQRALDEKHVSLPIIFITGHGDIPMTVRAMKAGAVDFLPKPFDNQDLLQAVRQALARAIQTRQEHAGVAVLEQRAAFLTPREQEVLSLVVSGLLNKQIGHRLGVSVQTIKYHRGHVMEKMGARSLAELVRMAEKLELEAPEPGPCLTP